jgi:L-ascorbate metabolism protein UlaG (beta-lactamase superfamily)
VPSRHIGKHEGVDHVSYIIEGSRCIWFMGYASPLQWKDRTDLPKPDILVAPFAYATAGGWEITRQLGAKVLVLLHLPNRDNDPHGLWPQVDATIAKGNGPAVYIPEMEQRILFTV